MKAVILAGGIGSRLSEETTLRPKPMVEIGGKPILWHIMKIYSAHGINEFIICLGYKGHIIKEYFLNYLLYSRDLTVNFTDHQVSYHNSCVEPWKLTLVDTGEETMTGGRLKRIQKYLGDEDFCFTYGDGVADIHIGKLIEFHRERKTLATVTATQPPGRFGALKIDHGIVTQFEEKPQDFSDWINGGFFVLSPKVLDYIEGDQTVWERAPLEKLSKMGQLSAFQHRGFWQPMDTLRDKMNLEKLWNSNQAPWKIWS